MEKRKKFYQSLSNMKISYKMTLAIYLVLLPALALCSIILFTVNYRTTMDETTALYERFTQNTSNEIGYLQRDAIDIMTYFTVNDDVNLLLRRKPEDFPQSKLFWYEETSVGFLENILAVKSHIKTLIIYPENGLTPFYISRDSSVHDTSLLSLHSLTEYENALSAQGDIKWARVASGKQQSLYLLNKTDKIVAYRELYNLAKTQRLAFLAIGMDASEFSNICSAALQEENEGIVVMDSTGQEFVRSGYIDDAVFADIQSESAQLQMKTDDKNMLRKDGYYIFYSRNEISGVQVYYFSPQENWTAKIQETIYYPIALALVILICAIPLSTMISKIVFRSTDRLCKSMEKFRKGDFSQQVPVTSNDEIGELSRSFNEMVHDIRVLIDKNYVMALRERESELDALQAQINPHFLYNVMDSLYWQAESAVNDELAENILAFSKLFRLLLSHGKSRIHVSQEIELVQCYLQIQKMRFDERITYTVTADDKMLNYIIPKLTIQPFVENAIVHGLEKQAEGGIVNVTGYIDKNYLMFIIEDNGAGMPQEEADRILFAAESDKYSNSRIGHYAIRNIKERLMLHYGDNYMLEITSAPGKGTTVRIGIPAQNE